MKYLMGVVFSIVLFPGYAFAAISSHECNVAKVESGEDSIIVFVENCERRSGPDTTMSQGNAFTNDASGSQTYIWIAQTSAEVQAREHMLSLALTALVTDKRIVFRWEPVDSRAVVSHILIK